MNKRGKKPLSLKEDNKYKETPKPVDLLAEADLSRFDKKKKKKNKSRNRSPKPEGQMAGVNRQNNPRPREGRESRPNGRKPQTPSKQEA